MSTAPGTGGPRTGYAVVVPTLVRDTLADCLAALVAAHGPDPDEIVLVDDRPAPDADPDALEHALTVLGDLRERTVVLRSGGRGPAAARNTGARAVTSPGPPSSTTTSRSARTGATSCSRTSPRRHPTPARCRA